MRVKRLIADLVLLAAVGAAVLAVAVWLVGQFGRGR